jgi:DNA repair and recombination protein RAD54B
LDGKTPPSSRQQIVNKFNAKGSETRVFLLSSKAGGTGLNLIGASRIVLFDIDWNPATDMQVSFPNPTLIGQAG